MALSRPLVSVETPAQWVRLVTLDRADRLNALDQDLVVELTTVLEAIAVDRDCRVVVLTGAGRAFSAGLDLAGYDTYDAGRDERDGPALAALARQREIAALPELLRRLPQPVIAAVNGAAVGGGLALVCAADIRIAAEPAIFAVSFITAGYSACDIGVSWFLPRLVGTGRAHELMLTGRKFGALDAERYGLVTEVVASDALLDAALAKAGEILLNAPASVELTKQGMWLAVETSTLHHAIELENRQQVITALTEDAAEATAAFLGRRPAIFTRR